MNMSHLHALSILYASFQKCTLLIIGVPRRPLAADRRAAAGQQARRGRLRRVTAAAAAPALCCQPLPALCCRCTLAQPLHRLATRGEGGHRRSDWLKWSASSSLRYAD